MRWFLLLLLLGVGCVPPSARPDDDDAGDDDDATGDDDDATSSTNPTALIAQPTDGATLNTPAAVSLEGAGTDVQDGDIPDGSLAWASDVDGSLGTGGSLVVELSVGDHTLTLTALDSDGNTGDASVDVVVTDSNALPQAFIDSPADGASFVEGDTLAFAGRATDLEDGDLTGGSLFWTSSVDGAFGSGTEASLVGASLGAHSILLTAVDSQGASGIASIAINVVAVGSNLPPIATITAPGDGDAFTQGDSIDFEGTGIDPEDGDLTTGALVWTSSLDGTLGTGSPLSLSTLSLGVHTVGLTATDDDGALDVASVNIVVNPAGNDPPAVSITSPPTGTTVGFGVDVELVGEATDPEDGALTDSDLVWTSSRDGLLGEGEEFLATGLSAGAHILTLTATDSAGALGIDTITLTVLPANTAPTATIATPATGASFVAGDVISFSGNATDPEDGPLTGAAVVWQSNLFGTMGTGTSLSFGSLPAGGHQITMTAVDSGGLSGSDSITITVDPSANNLPPVASLTGPATAEVGVAVVFDGSASSDPDGTIADYEFDFGDGTPVQSGAADSATHTYSAEGQWTVTLTVTDDDGDTGQATLSVESIIPEPVPEVVHDSEESYGGTCQIAVDASDLPHVVYRNTTHAALMYASYDGVSWTTEQIDGPGFDVGGPVSADFDLAVEPGGVPHIVYRFSNDPDIRWASKSSTVWERETVNSAYSNANPSGSLAIALDPVNGGRPTVGFSHYHAPGNDDYPVIAYRTGFNSWSEEAHTQTSCCGWFAGGMAFTASGVAWLTYSPTNLQVVNWSAAQGFVGAKTAVGSFGYSDYLPVVLDSSNEPIVLSDEGAHHFTGGQWIESTVEIGDFAHYDLGINAAGELWIALRHGSEIELITANPFPYWDYEYAGPMDSAQPGMAVDSTGKPWACFFRDGNLMVF